MGDFKNLFNLNLNRRDFLKASGTTASLLLLKEMGFGLLQPILNTDNPLDFYPSRDWEKVYLDQYKYDSSFTYVCSPNDTHACRVRGFLRNGIVIRTEQNYDVGRYADLYGNKATNNWNPRMCSKGYTIHRRIYGPHRLRYPLIRKGWKAWANDGFPYLNPENIKKYKFDSRGTDDLEAASWDQVYDYAAKGMIAIAKIYSGEEGKKRLLEQGYEPEVVDQVQGAGTRTMKFRGGMGLLGVVGKFGMYRFSNMMALLDSHVRGVSEKEAQGGRSWDNYTEHGDQAPGHPFVHGLQTSDTDFCDLRSTKLHIQVGKNLVENKMPDSHWFIESMERGGKIVAITPEYSPPATKADYWIGVRPSTDGAIFLAVSKIIIDQKKYDEPFLKRFTDMPMLVRSDTLQRLKAKECFKDYVLADISNGPSMKLQNMTLEQRQEIGDFVIFDLKTNSFKALTRDQVGETLESANLDPALEGKWTVTLTDGKKIEVMTLFEMYKLHLKDYDLESVCEITHAPKDLVKNLAEDISTIKPAAIHIGEGINHWFHATQVNRAAYLPLMLTGNIGKKGAGSFTWAGNYKSAIFQAGKEAGKGLGAWVAEDPFHPSLDEKVDGAQIPVKNYASDESAAYWAHSDRPLIVKTPKLGRKVFTGKSHMPTPSKVLWYTNVNHVNNAKWAYNVIKHSLPKTELIITTDIELTGSVEYADIALPANSWLEFEDHEITASCSNPFLQIWKGGIAPIYDTKDDALILAEMAKKLGEHLKDSRFEDYWKFIYSRQSKIYIQRLLDASVTLRGYKVDDILNGKFGEPGAALVLFRTYPRIPFYEQIHENVPFFTDTGRLNAYCDIPEAIEYGENFIVHREGPEATPYLPNVIVSANPYIRPEDYGISLTEEDADARTVRNVRMSWAEVKNTKNFLWENGFHFYCLTPKSRHTVHSQWSSVDWHLLWSSNFGDPWRSDKRNPGLGDHQVHMNPQAAKDLDLHEGDYVYVDSNPADRPYIGADPKDPFFKVARLLLRVKYNPAYPYHVVMMKHGTWIATEKTVKGHETRSDGQAISNTGYQANFRYGSQQSITREWQMPMHQTDHLFHKSKIGMKFISGGEADNHMINTVPKETLVRIVKAEAGGINKKGVWNPSESSRSPGNEDAFMNQYLQGNLVRVVKS